LRYLDWGWWNKSRVKAAKYLKVCTTSFLELCTGHFVVAIFGFIELFVDVSGFLSIGKSFSFGFSELWCGYFGFDNIGKASD
jgi:hypothetical protein